MRSSVQAAIVNIRQNGEWQFQTLTLSNLRSSGHLPLRFDGPEQKLMHDEVDWNDKAEEVFEEALVHTFEGGTDFSQDTPEYGHVKDVLGTIAVRYELANAIELSSDIMISDSLAASIPADFIASARARRTLQCDALLAFFLAIKRIDRSRARLWCFSILFPVVTAVVEQFTKGRYSYPEGTLNAIILHDSDLVEHSLSPGRPGSLGDLTRFSPYCVIFPARSAPIPPTEATSQASSAAVTLPLPGRSICNSSSRNASHGQRRGKRPSRRSAKYPTNLDHDRIAKKPKCD